MRADDPEEVTTVVRITRKWPTYGEYTNYTKGLQHQIDLQFVDRKTNRHLFTQTFYGHPPPDIIYKSPNEMRGSEIDDDEILKYLVELGKRQAPSR